MTSSRSYLVFLSCVCLFCSFKYEAKSVRKRWDKSEFKKGRKYFKSFFRGQENKQIREA